MHGQPPLFLFRHTSNRRPETPSALSPQHAYYIDFRNRRPDFIQTFMDKLINWDMVASRYAAATK